MLRMNQQQIVHSDAIQLKADAFRKRIIRSLADRTAFLKHLSGCTDMSLSYSESDASQFYRSHLVRRMRVGRKISDFRIIRVLGRGAFGDVFSVTERGSGKSLALKRIPKQKVSSPNQIRRSMTEREALAAIRSDRVVCLHSAFQDSVYLYMVMELLPGETLTRYLAAMGRFDENITRYYIKEIAEGINAIHNAGFIHRDIKPDNVSYIACSIQNIRAEFYFRLIFMKILFRMKILFCMNMKNCA